MKVICKMKYLVIIGLLFGCIAPDEDECVLDGKYEFGALSYTGCNNNSEVFYFNNEVTECFQEETSVDGTFMQMSCDPGNPVGECEGILTYANGCRYTTYVRRIAP